MSLARRMGGRAEFRLGETGGNRFDKDSALRVKLYDFSTGNIRFPLLSVREAKGLAREGLMAHLHRPVGLLCDCISRVKNILWEALLPRSHVTLRERACREELHESAAWSI